MTSAQVVRRLHLIRAALEAVAPTTLSTTLPDRDPFRLLIACIISLRTRDAVTRDASARLFARAADAPTMARLRESTIASLIHPAGFHRTKARQIRAIARALAACPDHQPPSTRGELLQLPGVGRKTANLVLGLGFGIAAICVDTHVHRIPNRLRWIRTDSPEQSEQALEELLPVNWWIPINDLLVTFGQAICQPTSPWCSRCPLQGECPAIGVRHRR